MGKRGPTSPAVIQETENAAGLVDSTPAPMITPTATAVPTITPRMTTRFTTTPTPIFTTSTVPSVQLVQANSRPSSFVEDEETDRSKNLPAGGRLGSSVSDGCDQISLTGSSFSLVNGLYGKVNENMYRRVDNLRLPGLIVAITNTKWCITYSFASSNLDTITRDDVVRACSSQLECCMLVSEMPTSRKLEDPERVWIVNMLDNLNKEDSNIEISCDTDGKSKLQIYAYRKV
jgi:hypothetical protein